MRKQLKALLMTVALVTLSTGLIGCNNEKKQQQTTTQVETTENKVGIRSIFHGNHYSSTCIVEN